MRRRHGSLRAPLAGPTANPPLESGGKSKLTRPHLPIARDAAAEAYALHILAELDPQAADHVDAVIYGHSHQAKIETKNGTLFFNPGSAGPRRFGLPITVGRVTAEHGKLRAEIVELSVEHHRRSIGRRRQRR